LPVQDNSDFPFLSVASTKIIKQEANQHYQHYFIIDSTFASFTSVGMIVFTIVMVINIVIVTNKSISQQHPNTLTSLPSPAGLLQKVHQWWNVHEEYIFQAETPQKNRCDYHHFKPLNMMCKVLQQKPLKNDGWKRIRIPFDPFRKVTF